MSFVSVEFFRFVAIVLLIYYVTPQRFRWIPLLGGSYYFYFTWNPLYLIYLVLPAFAVFWIALRMDGKKPDTSNRFYLILGILVPFSVLFVFKYVDLLIETCNHFVRSSSIKPLGLLLPIGISFYTFKQLSYVIDVYHKRVKAERHIGIYFLYVSFFPQLLAGPIDRAAAFIPELKKRVHPDWERTVSGIQLITWGLFKKIVIAERMAMFVNPVFTAPSHYSGINLIFGAYFYSLQIYCDFSGYSDMAIGVSRLFGIRSMDNFNFPYFSRSLADFWNRWHISLSTWLRDYLFLPIAYSILKWTKKPRVLNVKIEEWAYVGGITITMFLGGLWHGASWTFVIWGSVHGLYLALGRLLKRVKKRGAKITGIKKHPHIHHFLSVLFVFHLVTFSWIFFRSSSFAQAIQYIRNISFKMSGSGFVHLSYTLLFAVIFLAMEFFLKSRSRRARLGRMPVELKIAAYVVFVLFIILFSVDQANGFIYFNF